MYREVSQLLLYGNLDKYGPIVGLSRLWEDWARGKRDRAELCRRANAAVRRLLELASRYGLEGDLWRQCLALTLALDENPFSLSRERTPFREDSLSRLALSDLETFRRLMEFDFAPLEEGLGVSCLSAVRDFRAEPGSRCDREAGQAVMALSGALSAAPDGAAMLRALSDFYYTRGTGNFALYRAFRLREAGQDFALAPIAAEAELTLADLIGYDAQKSQLRANVAAFVDGRGWNNMLLYGDAGTGKSTSVKALLNEYAGQGLRMVEVYKHQFRLLPELIARLRGRNYPFMIFIDDLSFEENEVEYKYLKAVIEGGAEARPDNVMVCATSNRRHLIRETWGDRRDMEHDGDVHRSDTLEEKLSLAGRFGCAVNFSTPDRRLYHEIVKGIAAREGVEMDEEKLLFLANRWELRHGGVSGRAARQFVNAVSRAENED